MRNRNSRFVTSHCGRESRRWFFFGAAALAALAAAGCGGGGSPSPPQVKSPSIVTNPSPLTFVGGSATISVSVTDPTGVTQSSVKADVVDSSNNTSLIGGPQVMTLATPGGSTYTYQVNLPNNALGAVNKVYNVSVTATNKAGVTTTPPVAVGTITVPSPAPPPASP